ncbi:hypothetical protein AVEN_274090-1 [Araneus ventricosus]|uniref:Uncharacterized protein n=1 Tax=Araneus ventricosus TaxID=182803 RepID=A0A4Y2TZ34_ARAVE|nr:hypothetical protein AVEN_274090-1 [Araneus ventricosus]
MKEDNNKESETKPMFIPILKEAFQLVFQNEHNTLIRNKIGYLLLTQRTKPARRCESQLDRSVLFSQSTQSQYSTAFGISRVFYRNFRIIRISRNPNRGQPQLVRIPEVLLQ